MKKTVAVDALVTLIALDREALAVIGGGAGPASPPPPRSPSAALDTRPAHEQSGSAWSQANLGGRHDPAPGTFGSPTVGNASHRPTVYQPEMVYPTGQSAVVRKWI